MSMPGMFPRGTGGALLRARREEQGSSLAEVAYALGCCSLDVARIERDPCPEARTIIDYHAALARLRQSRREGRM